MSFPTWSSMSAISGDTTRVVPPRARPGSWKQSDFPAPVGMTSRTSCPSTTASQTASWRGRKASSRNRSRNIERSFVDPADAGRPSAAGGGVAASLRSALPTVASWPSPERPTAPVASRPLLWESTVGAELVGLTLGFVSGPRPGDAGTSRLPALNRAAPPALIAVRPVGSILPCALCPDTAPVSRAPGCASRPAPWGGPPDSSSSAPASDSIRTFLPAPAPSSVLPTRSETNASMRFMKSGRSISFRRMRSSSASHSPVRAALFTCG